MHCMLAGPSLIRVRVVSIGRIRYREVRFFVDFVLDFFITYILVNRGKREGKSIHKEYLVSRPGISSGQ